MVALYIYIARYTNVIGIYVRYCIAAKNDNFAANANFSYAKCASPVKQIAEMCNEIYITSTYTPVKRLKLLYECTLRSKYQLCIMQCRK